MEAEKNTPLIATQDFPYADRPLKVGDSFMATEEDARLLKGFGKAKDVAGRREMQAKATGAEGEGLFQAGAEGRTKRRYNRRDMQAEG